MNVLRLIGRFTCLCLQKAERKFIIGLMSLTRNVQRAIQMHDNLSQSAKSPAELLTGCFNGIKVCHVLLHTFSYSSLPFSFEFWEELPCDMCYLPATLSNVVDY